MTDSNRHLVLLNILIVFLFAACATPQGLERGVEYYEQGLYDQAASEWRPLADEGDAVAQHCMGVLSREGLGSTPLNYNDAARWFLASAEGGYVPAMVSLAEVETERGQEESAEAWLVLGARWGNTEAIAYLEQRGLPVPLPDLYVQQIQKQEWERDQTHLGMMRPRINTNDGPVHYPDN
jgi:TPR repeat protein